MKRLLVILLIIQVLLLTSCTLPLIGEIPKSSGTSDGQDMLTATGSALNAGMTDVTSGQAADLTGFPANSQTSSQSGIADAVIPADTADGTSSAISFGTTDEALALSEPVDVTSGSAVASATTGSAVAGEAWELEQTAPEQAGQGMEGLHALTVYYQDRDGCLIPMTRWVPMQQGIAKAAVGLCVDSAIAREEVAYFGVYPVLPVDTEILGLSIRDGIGVIDFNSHLLHYSGAEAERNIIACIVYTLTEFKNISKVRILVNGYPQGVQQYGTDLSEPLGREDVAINSQLTGSGSGQEKVDVFLMKKANEGFTYMAPVSVQWKDEGKEPVTNADEAELLLTRLLTGKGAKGVFSAIPDDVELLGCSTDNGVLTIDFSEAFLNYGGTDTEEFILRQIAYTVRQIDGIKSLKILVEGRPAQLPEGTDISFGIVIPAAVNDVLDRE